VGTEGREERQSPPSLLPSTRCLDLEQNPNEILILKSANSFKNQSSLFPEHSVVARGNILQYINQNL
jgi:hypothetical protein